MNKRSAPKLTREPGALGWPLGLIASLVIAFLILPVLFVIFYSFSESAYFRFPPQGLSLRWYANFFRLHFFQNGALISLALAAVVTPLSVAMGVAASYGLIRGNLRAATFINALLMSPIIIPGVVTGIACMTMFNLIGFTWSFGNLIIAMTLICLPYTVRTISANMHGLNPNTEEAAVNLGASRWTTFRRIVLPQIRPGIVGGMTQYKMSMYKKQMLYQQEGKRLVSVYPQDLPGLDGLLTAKLRLFGLHPSLDARSKVSKE